MASVKRERERMFMKEKLYSRFERERDLGRDVVMWWVWEHVSHSSCCWTGIMTDETYLVGMELAINKLMQGKASWYARSFCEHRNKVFTYQSGPFYCCSTIFESKFQSIYFFWFWNIQKRILFEKGHLVLSKMAPRFKREWKGFERRGRGIEIIVSVTAIVYN